MNNKEIKAPLLKLAIEYWRVMRSYERNLSLIQSAGAMATLKNSERKFLLILSENRLQLINYEGKDYSPNLPITALNSEEFESNEDLFIVQMIEPTILDDEGVVNIGKVILGRKRD